MKCGCQNRYWQEWYTLYPMKYAHGLVVLCFVVVMQSSIMNSHEVFIHIHQGCFAGTGAIVRLPQCQWSKPDGYGKISQCITTTKHSKAKTVCIFLVIYCMPGIFSILLNIQLWPNYLRDCDFLSATYDHTIAKYHLFLNGISMCTCIGQILFPVPPVIPIIIQMM